MNLKFWQRKQSNIAGGSGMVVKLKPPKELPQTIGMYLVTREKIDPDEAWSLKCVLKPFVDNKRRFYFRIFNPAKCAKLMVKNYDSLQDSPELILYHGWFDKSSNDLNIKKGAD